jgi:hypothetical protein
MVSAYYISKAGVITIIQLLLNSTWEQVARVDTHSGSWAPSATGGGKVTPNLHDIDGGYKLRPARTSQPTIESGVLHIGPETMTYLRLRVEEGGRRSCETK